MTATTEYQAVQSWTNVMTKALNDEEANKRMFKKTRNTGL